MDYNRTVRKTRLRHNEHVLTVLAGLRKVGNLSSEDRAYNDALADVFDYIIEHEKDNLFQHTVNCGKWVRD